MNIVVRKYINFEDVVPMKSTDDLVEGSRLFYELNELVSEDRITGKMKFKGIGEFKEIRDIPDMIKNDEYINNPEYIKHHNFVILHKK